MSSSSPSLSVPNCNTPDEEKPDEGKILASNAESLAKSMGMDKECVRKATDSAMTASLSGSLNIPFASAGFQASMTGMDSSMEESGCGSFFLDSSKVLNQMTNMSCTLSQTKSTNSVSVSANATVRIKVSADSVLVEQRLHMQQQMLERAQTSYDKITDRVLDMYERIAHAHTAAVAEADSPEKAASILSVLERSLVTLEKMQTESARALQSAKDLVGAADIDIRDSTITATADTTIQQINTADSTMEEKLTQSFETIAKASAQNTMQRSLGHHAMQDSMKRVAESEVTNRQSDIKNVISQTISETSASATSDSTVEILAPTRIVLENTTISATVLLDMATTSMATQAMDIGRDVANKILADREVVTEDMLASKGVDDLQKALGETTAGNINAGKAEPLDWKVILAAGAALMAGAYAYSQGNSTPPQGVAKAVDTKKLAAGRAAMATGMV